MLEKIRNIPLIIITTWKARKVYFWLAVSLWNPNTENSIRYQLAVKDLCDHYREKYDGEKEEFEKLEQKLLNYL